MMAPGDGVIFQGVWSPVPTSRSAHDKAMIIVHFAGGPMMAPGDGVIFQGVWSPVPTSRSTHDKSMIIVLIYMGKSIRMKRVNGRKISLQNVRAFSVLL